MPKSIDKLTEEFYEKNLRADKVLHLPSMAPDTDEPCSEFTDTLEYGWELLELLGKDKDEDGNEREEVSSAEVTEILYQLMREGQYGFLVQISTPFPSYIELKEDGTISGYSYSWGHTTGRWFKADSMEEVMQDALAWKQQFMLEQVKKQSEQ